jgi:hypothetical protein
MKARGGFFDRLSRVLILFLTRFLFNLTGQNRQHGMPGVLQKRGKQKGGESGMWTSLLFGLLDTMVAQGWWHSNLSHVQGAY